jgi:hypothetical protein
MDKLAQHVTSANAPTATLATTASNVNHPTHHTTAAAIYAPLPTATSAAPLILALDVWLIIIRIHQAMLV